MPAVSHETDKDRYILHLNQALAMEAALVDHLDKEATAVPFPDLQQRLRQHRDETIQHRDRVRAVITELGGTPTPTKATIQPPVTPGLMGKVMTALESEKEDRLLMDVVADYAVEHFEDGLYAALGEIARNLGYAAHVEEFEAIRKQERAMAEYLAARMPEQVRQAFPPTARAA